jgi:hypothetical protein
LAEPKADKTRLERETVPALLFPTFAADGGDEKKWPDPNARTVIGGVCEPAAATKVPLVFSKFSSTVPAV